jgi:P-type Ca2+ transporter type 2C
MPIVQEARFGADSRAGTFRALATFSWLGLDARATVTLTFLSLGFAQLWHTFDMRDLRSPLIVNEITQNCWLWSTFVLCATLLAMPPYLPRLVLPLRPPLTCGQPSSL